MRRAIAVLATLTITGWAGGAAAQTSVAERMAADPGDRAVVEAVAAVNPNTADIATLDALLARLPRPTPLRGMVQTMRAYVLGKGQDEAKAVVAIEEAMRLLPDDVQPKLIAVLIFTFSGAEVRAADLWLQASRDVPAAARTTDPYVLSALVGRLRDRGENERADRVEARMGEIGLAAGSADDRSSSALARTRDAVRRGDMAAAGESLTGITDPSDLATLYLDRGYAALWPRIADWAGARLELAHRRYLEELRRDWTPARGFTAAIPYARELSAAHAHPAVVGLFQPLFETPSKTATDPDRLQLAPVVARALDRMGRGSEARALLAAQAAATANDRTGNGLNIDGAYITLAAQNMDWQQVADRSTAFLAKAAGYGAGINASATIKVRSLRACALSRIGQADAGRADAAAVLSAAAQMPEPALELHLCRGDADAARALLIDRLANPDRRGWALKYVQPVALPPDTPLSREQAALAHSIRTAPDVVAAATAVGRILPEPLAAGVPDGFDPFRAQPRPADRPLTRGTT